MWGREEKRSLSILVINSIVRITLKLYKHMQERFKPGMS
jgi:hypothetical protein